jgi:hypothetical protein
MPKIQRTSPGGMVSMTLPDGNNLATQDAGQVLGIARAV